MGLQMSKSPSPRRFVPPWGVTQIPAGWQVSDRTGVVLAWFYGSDNSKGAGDRSLTMDEARRLATGFARLPELMGWVAAPKPVRDEGEAW